MLSGLTTSELENLVLVREEARGPISDPRRQREARPIPPPRRRRQQQEPRRTVQQLIQRFEATPIPPYRPHPTPRMKEQQPVPAPGTRIDEKRRALIKDFAKSFEISLKSDRDALVQMQNTRLAISSLFDTILQRTKGFKFVETLVVNIVKKKDGEDTIHPPVFFNSRAQTVINPNDFMSSLQSSQQQILKSKCL